MISDSETLQYAKALREPIREWVLQGFQPRYGELAQSFREDERWQALQASGTTPWLDTGDLQQSKALWSREFKALTTNNSLLNNEVQSGQYDDLVKRTAAHIRKLQPSIPQNVIVMETAFVLNAYHGLRLVEAYDVSVSVEEHTDLAHNYELAVFYGERFFEICPERFIVKLPMTAAGLLAMRTLRQKKVPINFTLGFSARHNYVAARIGDPNYVNVFLGRLNAFVEMSKIGTGTGVGEKTTAASQEALTALRKAKVSSTQQIAASLRNAQQIWDLAGVDVMTIPPSVATEYHDSDKPPVRTPGSKAEDIKPGIDDNHARSLRVNVLWEIAPELEKSLDALTQNKLNTMDAQGLVRHFEQFGVTDLLPEYSPGEIEIICEDGKIPKLQRWRRRIEHATTSIDSLLNVSGLHSFAADQRALDDRIRGLLH